MSIEADAERCWRVWDETDPNFINRKYYSKFGAVKAVLEDEAHRFLLEDNGQGTLRSEWAAF